MGWLKTIKLFFKYDSEEEDKFQTYHCKVCGEIYPKQKMVCFPNKQYTMCTDCWNARDRGMRWLTEKGRRLLEKENEKC